MKIVADQQISYVQQAFSNIGKVVLVNGREIDTDLVRDADVLLVRSVTQVGNELLQNSPIKFVATATSGTDHIDIDYLKQSNISFAYAPGCNARSVAEYVFSSLFVLAEQKGFRLTDKTVGIIGCGEVGSRVLRFLKILGVSCVVNDPPLQEKTGDNLYSDIADVLAADIITLHVPLLDDGLFPTRHLVDEDFLTQIKQDCVLINTSRGGVIDQAALKNHIKKNPECLMVLDVWANEPEIDVKLLSHVAIGTPHIAGYSIDGKLQATYIIAQQIYDFFKKKLEWTLPADIFLIEPLAIRITENLDMYDAVQLAVLSHYDPRSDAASLRRLSEISIQERADYFDALRKNYPVRREFPATVVHLNETTKGLVNIYDQLGFMVKLH